MSDDVMTVIMDHNSTNKSYGKFQHPFTVTKRSDDDDSDYEIIEEVMEIVAEGAEPSFYHLACFTLCLTILDVPILLPELPLSYNTLSNCGCARIHFLYSYVDSI
jgi:hypothetical protein